MPVGTKDFAKQHIIHDMHPINEQYAYFESHCRRTATHNTQFHMNLYVQCESHW